MSTLIDSLKTRYDAVLQSDSDPSFYKNVHAYIDYIVKTPVLSAIMDKSENEYSKEHSEIWRVRKSTDYEIDYQSALTNRIEDLSLFAEHYVTLLVRIYEPMEEYIHPSPDLADTLDPVALLMLKGFKRTEGTGLWSIKSLKMFNRQYEGKRNEYENHLKQFHVDFLKEVEKIEEPETEQKETPISLPKEKAKPVIFIDDKKGIYEKSNEQSAYGVEKNSKRFKIITHLLTKDNCSVSELAKDTDQTDHVTMKAIAEINRLFRKNVGQAYDLIRHTDTVGYFLNTEKFEIQKAPNL